MGLTAIDHLDVWVESQSESNGRGRGATRRTRNVGLIQLRKLILDLAITGKLCPNNQEMNSIQSLVENDLQQQVGKKYKFRKLSEKEQFQSIPKSWVWTDIRSIGYPLEQKKPDRRFTYIDVGSIESGSGKIIEPSLLEASEAPSRARKIVKNGTVIYSTVRPYLNNIAVIENDFDEEPIASTAFAVVHPSKHVNSQYIYYYLLSPTFVQYVESVQAGIAYPSINNKQFYGAPFPLPPLEEQKRIVAKVDELMGLIDDLEAQTEAARESHDELVDALLHALVESVDANSLTQNWTILSTHFDTLFTTEESVEKLKATAIDLAVRGILTGASHGSPVPNSRNEFDLPFALPKTWELSTIGDLCSKVGAGSTPTGGKKVYVNDGIPFLRSQNVWNDGLFLEDISCIPDDIHEKMSGTKVQPEDILYNITGASIGRCAIAPQHPFEANVSQHVSIIRLHDKSLNEFVHKVLISSTLQKLMMDVQVGVSREGLGVGKLKKFPIPIPPPEEREEIIAKVKSLIVHCDDLLANIRTSEALKVELAESVVHHASNG